jgi:acetyl-CoA synthetase
MTENIESLLHENRVFDPPKGVHRDRAHVKSLDEYKAIYKRSVDDPEGYWGDRSRELITWMEPFGKVKECDFHKASFKWFLGGKLNVAHNCLDRHLDGPRRNKAAIIWQGDKPGDVQTLTYQMLYDEVCKFANVLKSQGVKKGDRVAIYLGMVPELAIAMLACARIGAPHSIVFAGFSANSLRDRINDCQAKVVVCGDAVRRAGKAIPLKNNVDEALKECPTVEKVIMHSSAGTQVNFVEGRDLWWHEEMAKPEMKAACPPEPMDSEDVLFILYTSGSTGKPKGVFHTTGGYLTYVAHTTQMVFDIHEEDIHWCTADIGWVTGHSYIVYGPLALGATSVMFEGVPTWPGPDRFWATVEKFKVNIFYTAPTAIRALMREGVKWTQNHDLSTLRILGSVGEPINPEAWMWYHEHIGKGKLPIVDTWWQTETGGLMISPLPYATPLKPGSASFPLPGVVPKVVDKDGKEVGAGEGGFLVQTSAWPGMLRGVWGDPGRYKKQYFDAFPGTYETGDGARKDADGYVWIMGRVDDVVNVSGHRLGTAEIESALVAHPDVAEAAVVGMPHDIKGQAIYAYVTVKEGVDATDELLAALKKHVRAEIGPIATPDVIQFAQGLPKTRSGKIMRRILRKIAEGETSTLGDTSTLADPSVVTDLIEGKEKLFG